MKAFVAWSGGKDSALAYYRACQMADIDITYLVNMLNDDGAFSRSHHVPADLLGLQGEKMGIPIVQKVTTWDDYEGRFKEAIIGLKENGVEAGIFGDIDIQEHRDWVERVCMETDIIPVLPLWHYDREELLTEFIEVGFKAIVVVTNASCLSKEWLGRQIDGHFVDDLRYTAGIDLCGEKGEYHTFVCDGPIFKEAIVFTPGEPILVDGYWFLKIT
jgi:uncharacterized protein (TIGR00290 family)